MPYTHNKMLTHLKTHILCLNEPCHGVKPKSNTCAVTPCASSKCVNLYNNGGTFTSFIYKMVSHIFLERFFFPRQNEVRCVDVTCYAMGEISEEYSIV